RGEVGEARRWFGRLQEAGVRPNVFSWTSLVGAYARVGDLEEAMRVLEGMRESGCQPNEVTYLVLIDCAAKKERAELAEGWVRDMVGAGLPVKVEHVVALMDARVRSKILEGVRECWKWLLGGNWPGAPRPSTSHCVDEAAACVYLDAMGRLSDYGELESTWKELHRLPDFAVAMNQKASYVEALLRLGEVGPALRIVEEWGEEGDNVKIGVTLLGGLSSRLGRKEAGESFDRCTKGWRDATKEEVKDIVGRGRKG
ncbi:hypothetical protein HK097_007761, partial [Rhizophlyctis rosea]